MLGITVTEAIAVGTLLASFVVAILGTKSGAAAAKVRPPPEAPLAVMGGMFVDTSTFQALVRAVDRLADVGEQICEAEHRREERRRDEEIADLRRRLDEAEGRRVPGLERRNETHG